MPVPVGSAAPSGHMFRSLLMRMLMASSYCLPTSVSFQPPPTSLSRPLSSAANRVRSIATSAPKKFPGQPSIEALKAWLSLLLEQLLSMMLMGTAADCTSRSSLAPRPNFRCRLTNRTSLCSRAAMLISNKHQSLLNVGAEGVRTHSITSTSSRIRLTRAIGPPLSVDSWRALTSLRHTELA